MVALVVMLAAPATRAAILWQKYAQRWYADGKHCRGNYASRIPDTDGLDLYPEDCRGWI